jgi:3-phosphoshikimate 1-carboxyvinyltransferase
MNEAIITPSSLSGTVDAPSSKSLTHRALYCALLAPGTSHVQNAHVCDDTAATNRLCTALGASISREGTVVTVEGVERPVVLTSPVDCGGSATTLRLGMAVAAMAGNPVTLTGDRTLCTRPLGHLTDALARLGVWCSAQGTERTAPVTVAGPIKGGKTTLPGSVSSQFLSSLLIACPTAAADTAITLSSPLASRPYADLTVAFMEAFGVSVSHTPSYRSVSIPGGQAYRPTDLTVEGDYSSAAALLSAGARAGTVTGRGRSGSSAPGAAAIVAPLASFGAAVSSVDKGITVSPGELSAITADCTHTPRPCTRACRRGHAGPGTTRLLSVGRLRTKESDRLQATAETLTAMGARISVHDDELAIEGPTPLSGATVWPHHDHRIAMACAVAALVASGPTIITDAGCVDKSYPRFFADLAALGGDVRA